MGALAMIAAMVAALGVFGWMARTRWKLMRVGRSEDRFDRPGARLSKAITIAFFQKKMPKYPVMGPIHIAIFWGFLVLLINTLILWGRAFDLEFNLFILGDNPLGDAYRLVKDVIAVVVLVAAALALINRVILRPERLTRSMEASVILLIIIVMMVADLVYWGWQLTEQGHIGFGGGEPFAGWMAGLLSGLAPEQIALVGTVGYWTHSLLVLVFLNLLPLGKHFHVITAIPNVFFTNLGPFGRLPRDENIEKVLAEEDEDEEEEPVFGVAEVQHFTWKDILDMYSCTECGRCTDNCPASRTGKPLRPKSFLCDVRNHLYSRQAELIKGDFDSKELVPEVVDPAVIWNCTTCRACEEECPVMITYVDKFIKLRRDLVEGRGEPPTELANALRGIETNSNPWNLSPMDRDDWKGDLQVPEYDPESCEYLFFVGCMASFDDRARQITQSLVRLFEKAGISYGYLGTDEPCCGETARRAGSESNFRMTVDANVEVLGELGVKKIVTGCPHCFNTFKNEYPEFGGSFEVVHHTELLAELVAAGRLQPTESISQPVTFHDACYLGRYNQIYDAPRRILERIPGLDLREVATSKKRGLCCGAGGARFFMEEEGERINNRRVGELLEAEPDTLASACPYCMTMLSDGLKDKDLFDTKAGADVAELLSISCGLEPARKISRAGENE